MYESLHRKWFPFKEEKIHPLKARVDFIANERKTYVSVEHWLLNNLHYPFTINSFDFSIEIFTHEVVKINHSSLFLVGAEQEIPIKIEQNLTEANLKRIKELTENKQNIYCKFIITYVVDYEKQRLSFQKTVDSTIFIDFK